MEIQWKQDSKTKSIQPRQLPQFEVAGPQQDNDNYERAMKAVVSRVVGMGLLLMVIPLIFLFRGAMNTHKTDFARISSNYTDPYKDRIIMTMHAVKTQDKVKGFLVDSTAQAGFHYLVVDLSIHNRSGLEYRINPYAFSLITGDEAVYSTDLATRNFKGRMRNEILKDKKNKRGFLVFKIPKAKSIHALQLRGTRGPLSKLLF